jgi:hypothetical protein
MESRLSVSIAAMAGTADMKPCAVHAAIRADAPSVAAVQSKKKPLEQATDLIFSLRELLKMMDATQMNCRGVSEAEYQQTIEEATAWLMKHGR